MPFNWPAPPRVRVAAVRLRLAPMLADALPVMLRLVVAEVPVTSDFTPPPDRIRFE